MLTSFGVYLLSLFLLVLSRLILSYFTCHIMMFVGLLLYMPLFFGHHVDTMQILISDFEASGGSEVVTLQCDRDSQGKGLGGGVHKLLYDGL